MASPRVKQTLMAAAGAAGGDPLNVEDLFSTFLYTGNGGTQSIVNNIDLSGEGGLVWIKKRSSSDYHALYDTERGVQKYLSTNLTDQEYSSGVQGLNTFNNNGFTMGTEGSINNSSSTYTSWTFRKAPKFFDCFTFSGDGQDGRQIAHSLGQTPGMIIIKRTDGSQDWYVWHKSSTNVFSGLNTSNAAGISQIVFGNTAPTSTHFTLDHINHVYPNHSGQSYVAYLFADNNNGDGGFGETGDQDIIKCGGFTSSSSIEMQSITLGFEPQWVLLKQADGTSDWMIIDTMRGAPIVTVYTGDSQRLRANLDNGESADTVLHPTATGFNYRIDDTSSQYIYMAIRRGPMAIPTSGTDVFYVQKSTGADYTATFPADLLISTRTSSAPNYVFSRLTDRKYLLTNATDAEADAGSGLSGLFADQTGVNISPNWWGSSTTNTVGWLWRRAPSYFDVVCYIGNGTSGRTVTHNLGVVPEMMWVFRRSDTANRYVYHAGVNNGATNTTISLDTTLSVSDFGNFDFMNGTQPTSSVFSLSHTAANVNNTTYIAFLFATLAGISKVGTFTGNGSSQNIDCGFSNGARFVLVKATSQAGSWLIFDTARGLVSGNDSAMGFDNNLAEAAVTDYIDPHSSGFTINSAHSASDTYNPNSNNVSYIFYAIA